MAQDGPIAREPHANQAVVRLPEERVDGLEAGSPPQSGAWRRRIRRSVAPLVAVVFLVPFAGVFLRKGERSEWHTCYMQAARRLVAGEVINRSEPNAYAYPPAMAMCCTPLANLPASLSMLAWYGVNALALIVVWAGAWRLMGGPGLMRLEGKWPAVFGLGVLLSFRFVAAPLETQQFDLVIVALLTCGCLAWQRDRAWSAAAWWGIAAAMKCTPLLFAPYLAWRGRLKPALMLVLVAVAMNRLPDFIWPRSSGLYVSDWAETFLFNVGRRAPGVWDSDLQLNQSLSGLFNRFIQAGVPWSTDAMPSGLARLSAESIRQIRYGTYGASLLLVALTAWRMKHPGRLPPPEEIDRNGRDSGPLVLRRRANEELSRSGVASPIRAAEPVAQSAVFRATQPGRVDASLGVPRRAIECASIACLMLLLSPMSSKAHYVVLVLPALIVSRGVVERASRVYLWLLPLLLLTGPLTSKGLIGKRIGDLTLVWGWPTFFVLFLLVAMWRGMTLASRHKSARERPFQTRAAA